MRLMSGASLRALIPGLAVATVLTASLIAGPAAPLGQSVAFGYGYGGNGGNNCGVKGLGTHDHGKKCPNRPFPGHDNGVTDETGVSGTTGTTGESQGGSSDETTDETGVTTTTTTSTTTESSGAAVKSHGHGKGHGHGRGRSE